MDKNWCNLATEAVIVGLATYGVMVAWFYGSIFATTRAYLEVLSDKNKIAYLLTCSICIPYHVALWLWVLGRFVPLMHYVLLIFAAAGLASFMFKKSSHS